MKFGIGQPVTRKEDPKFLMGRGRYVDDIELPNMTHGYVLRSIHANARINSIDVNSAKNSPGVISVLTGEDYAADEIGSITCDSINPMLSKGEPQLRPHPALVKDVVKCVGAPVAFVVAETLVQAKDAAELIQIDYEILPSVTSVSSVREKEAPIVWEGTEDNISFTFGIGNADGVAEAIKNAKHITKATIVNNRITTNSMEPRSSIGAYNKGEDKLTLYSSNQSPNRVRSELAHTILHIPENKLQVISPDVGGGFGMKGGFYGEDVLVLWASRKLGRPVKWTSERLESFVTDSHARDVVADCEMVFDADGKVTGLRVSADYSVGAYVAPSGGISPMFFTLLLSGVYAIPAISVVTRCQFTNTISTAPYRGAGRPEAAFVLERLMDMAAQELGTDPVELRRKNMIKSDQMPYQTALMHAYDSGEFEQIMDEAVEKSEWHSFQSRWEKSKIGGKVRGIGLASYLEGAAPFNERMEIRFDPGGDVTIVAGTHSHGQGHETVYSQMVSEFLGVPFESIRLIQGDTDKVAMGRGTVGSRSMTVGGSALHLAAEEIIEKGKKIAGHLLEAGETDIEFDSGVFSVAGTDKQINIVEVAKSSYTLVMWPPHLGMGLEGIGTFNPGMGNFPNGCQIAEVEIDPETGKVELVNLVIVGDVGTVINPLLLEGQIHGGITQGVGQATLENIVYEGNSGQLLSASFQDYTMPRADDLPLYDVSSHPVPTTTNPLGVKGAGETGTVGAPAAVLNAIVNALSSVGVKDIEMPATSEKVWQALQNAA